MISCIIFVEITNNVPLELMRSVLRISTNFGEWFIIVIYNLKQGKCVKKTFMTIYRMHFVPQICLLPEPYI